MLLSGILIISFLLNTLGILPLAQAQDFHLPIPGVMVRLSPPFDPPMLKGIKVHPNDPLQFDFILDRGEGVLGNDELKDDSTQLIKYFLASLTIPENDLWVNLSPYEKDRIIPQGFGLTEMGRDLLAEDYMLKQITASLIYPEDGVGKKFWQRIYEEASRKYGTTNIPVNTFNKVWIVPEKAIVYENAQAGTAYVVESKLKVMLEQDYLSLEKHEGIKSDKQGQSKNENINALGSQIVREIVIPELTKEVNDNKSFAKLRQVYNSLILATWYKKRIKDSILAQVYADKKKIAGIGYDQSVIAMPTRGHLQDRTTKNVSPSTLPSEIGATQSNETDDVELIYQRYLTAFKKGVYNYIKEEQDPLSQQMIPRKYFSGGFNLAMTTTKILSVISDFPNNAVILSNDRAMTVKALIRGYKKLKNAAEDGVITYLDKKISESRYKKKLLKANPNRLTPLQISQRSRIKEEKKVKSRLGVVVVVLGVITFLVFHSRSPQGRLNNISQNVALAQSGDAQASINATKQFEKEAWHIPTNIKFSPTAVINSFDKENLKNLTKQYNPNLNQDQLNKTEDLYKGAIVYYNSDFHVLLEHAKRGDVLAASALVKISQHNNVVLLELRNIPIDSLLINQKADQGELFYVICHLAEMGNREAQKYVESYGEFPKTAIAKDVSSKDSVVTKLIDLDVLENVSDTMVRVKPGLIKKRPKIQRILEHEFGNTWLILLKNQDRIDALIASPQDKVLSRQIAELIRYNWNAHHQPGTKNFFQIQKLLAMDGMDDDIYYKLGWYLIGFLNSQNEEIYNQITPIIKNEFQSRMLNIAGHMKNRQDVERIVNAAINALFEVDKFSDQVEGLTGALPRSDELFFLTNPRAVDLIIQARNTIEAQVSSENRLHFNLVFAIASTEGFELIGQDIISNDEYNESTASNDGATEYRPSSVELRTEHPLGLEGSQKIPGVEFKKWGVSKIEWWNTGDPYINEAGEHFYRYKFKDTNEMFKALYMELLETREDVRHRLKKYGYDFDALSPQIQAVYHHLEFNAGVGLRNRYIEENGIQPPMAQKGFSEKVRRPERILRFLSLCDVSFERESSTNQAMMSPNGGIDLTAANMNLQMKNSNGEINFHIDPAQLSELQNALGFESQIISIEPMIDVRQFLGLEK